MILSCHLLEKSLNYTLSTAHKTRTRNSMMFVQKSRGRNTEGIPTSISVILGLGYILILGSTIPVITRTGQKCVSILCRIIGLEGLRPGLETYSCMHSLRVKASILQLVVQGITWRIQEGTKPNNYSRKYYLVLITDTISFQISKMLLKWMSMKIWHFLFPHQAP